MTTVNHALMRHLTVSAMDRYWRSGPRDAFILVVPR